MAKKLSQGDTVRISDREATAADTKLGLFYPHYRNLIGTIAKVYPDETVTVTVDPDSLSPALRARHVAGTSAMRQKWLDGLSDEARNRLSAAEKKFDLRYTILVAIGDLSPIKEKPSVVKELPTPAKENLTPAKAAQPTLDIDPEPPRRSLADIEAEEERHLAEVARKKKDTPSQ